MNKITLTLEATPENAALIAKILEQGTNCLTYEAHAEAEIPKEKPPKEKPPKEKPKKAEGPTTSELRELGLRLTKEGKQDGLKAALEKFGAKKLSEVETKDYPALYEAFQEALS